MKLNLKAHDNFLNLILKFSSYTPKIYHFTLNLYMLVQVLSLLTNNFRSILMPIKNLRLHPFVYLVN